MSTLSITEKRAQAALSVLYQELIARWEEDLCEVRTHGPEETVRHIEFELEECRRDLRLVDQGERWFIVRNMSNLILDCCISPRPWKEAP